MANEIDSLSTGKRTQSNTATIVVTVDDIRKANIKLNERLILLDIINSQELQLDNYARLSKVNDSIIEYYRDNIIKYNNVNNSLKEQINKSNSKIKHFRNILLITGGASISIIAILSLIK